VVAKVRQLHTLRGIGPHSAWLSGMAVLRVAGGSAAATRGALAGLTPTP
jgi:hypothetical protein